MSLGGVTRVSINALKPGLTDNLIVGVIIGRQTPRKIKKEGLDGQRAVWDITLRDSLEDFINVTFWGSLPHLNGLADLFHVGDVVDIINAKISVRTTTDNFRPFVSSPFQLTMSDSNGKIIHHEGDDCATFFELKNYPTKPITNIFTIADIHSKGAHIGNETVDLLVAVRSVDPMRTITTKDGRKMINRVVIVMDYTSDELPLQIWNSDIVQLADSWKPRDTAASVRQVMTIQQVLDRCKFSSEDGSSGDDSQFTALIYCLITHMDLDGSTPMVVTKCNSCELPVENELCMNSECRVGNGSFRGSIETSFDLRVSLTDHTGSLEFCRLNGLSAERVLKCTAKQFSSMSLENKTQLKWTLLLERCAARILILRPSICNPRPSICLLSCCVSDPTEAAARIPLS
ncbi:Protein hold'em [Gryllus bimaculatus]|nr:Protein hold'em [Gryllus bimaculatus]